MASTIARITSGAHIARRLFGALLPVLLLGSACNSGSDTTSSPYGSTLLVKFYSDPHCKSELATQASRFAVPKSGETSCKAHSSFKHVSLSVDLSAIKCDPSSPSSCALNSGSSIGYKVGCDADCSVCESSQLSDGTYHLEECAPMSGSGSKDSDGGYLKVTNPGYTGAFYLGASEKNPGSSIKMYDPETLSSVYLDTSGSPANNYPTSMAVLDDDSNTLYASLLNRILWQCSSTQGNSCGTWNTTPSVPNMMIAANGYIYVAIKNGDVWQCPPNSSNSCVSYASFPVDVISLAYDEGTNDLYVGTACNPCESAQIYKLPNLGSGSPAESVFSVGAFDGSCENVVQDMVFGGGQLWATSWSKCEHQEDSDGEIDIFYTYAGSVATCASGSCKVVSGGTTPYWGATYDPVENLVFLGKVGPSTVSLAAGIVEKVAASSFDTPTSFVNLGTLANGVVTADMSSALPPQALLYAGGYLWIGTGALSCASCNSLFRCPVTADNINPNCAQVKLNCGSSGGCMGAQSMAYIAEVNYPGS